MAGNLFCIFVVSNRVRSNTGLSFPLADVVHHLCGDGDLNLNTGLDVDDDLLDDLSGGVKVDQTLVDPIATMSVQVLPLIDCSNPEVVWVPRHRGRGPTTPSRLARYP